MEQKLLEIAFKSFLEEFIKLTKGVFSEGEKELAHLFKVGLRKYLKRQQDKFTSMKTILQGSTPVYLYDFYFPLKLIDSKLVPRYHEDYYSPLRDTHSFPTDSITDLFKKGKYLTIMGDAGSGKSTLIKHLFLNCIKEKYAVPFLLELRYLNDYNGSIENFILEKIFENEIGENYRIVNRMLDSGKFVFFLDGYDEINTNMKEKVVKSIDDFITKYPDNKYILTSRPYSNIEHFQKFKNFNVNRLNEEDIDNFIEKQLKKEKELALKIKQSIRENRNLYIKTFLTNPLLLSLYILTYQTNSEIPPKKYIFYRRVIQALFSEHDSKTKIGYRRERKTELTQEQFEEILKRFSFLSFFESKYDFELDYINDLFKTIKSKLINTSFDNNRVVEDLKSALALWVEDNGVYAFAHRSMQEYYVANFIKRLDDNNKLKIYNKIIQRSADKLTSETENLLSLCEEMDTFYFYKFYKLPLLIDLRSKIHNHSDENLVKSLICHLCSDIVIDFNDSGPVRPHEITINNDVYKCLFFHLSHMRQLHLTLSEFRSYVSSINNSKKKVFKYHLTEDNFPDEVLQFARKKNLNEFARGFLNWLDSEISQAQSYLDKTSQSNDELVSMI